MNSKLNANLSIDAGAGNDTINTFGSGDWTVRLGAGSDTYYADNTAAKAVWVFNTSNQNPAFDPPDRELSNLRSDANNGYVSVNDSVVTGTPGYQSASETAGLGGLRLRVVFQDVSASANVSPNATTGQGVFISQVIEVPTASDNKFLVTMQNCGVTRLTDGALIAVTEDVRNGNGRAMKSKFWSPNRIDRIDEPLNAIFWLMRDPTIPPVLKLTGPELGSVLGATLATKRTSAERLAPGVDPNALVCEPYANPFRTYPLDMDYTRFKQLLADGVDCYILNTGLHGHESQAGPHLGHS